MKAKNLWVAIALVCMVQGITAQKIVKSDVALASYKQFESTLLDALKKYREDYLRNGVAAPLAEQELVIVAQEAIFAAFIADKDKVVDAMLAQPVTVLVNINLTYDKSKDFPKVQDAYVTQMTNFWNGFAGRGIKESIGYTPRSGETASNVAKTVTTVTEELNGQVKSVITTTKQVSTTESLAQIVQTAPRPVNFKTPKDLEPYINPLLNEVTKFVHQWVNTWQIR